MTGTTTTVIGPATFRFLAGRTTVIYAIGSAAGKSLTVAVQRYHVPQVAAPAEVTVVHGIPSTPVDVYVNGKLTLPDFTFGKVAGPLALPAGTYAVSVRPQGAPTSSAPILSQTVTVTSGEDASIVANLTASGSPPCRCSPTRPRRSPWATPGSSSATWLMRRASTFTPGSTKVITDLTNPDQAVLVIPGSEHSR